MSKGKSKSEPGRLLFRRMIPVVLLLLSQVGSRAFTTSDADASFAAYHKAFYFTNDDKGFYRATTDGGKTWFWERAEQMEMVLDHYERTTNVASLVIFSNVFNGFIADHGTNWSQNEFNDDIMWMVIACARAHQLTGNATFRDAAKLNFDMCYDRAWSTNLGGGLWWKTSNSSKNACVNGPGAIAAFLLYQIYGDTNYLSKARAIYEWERIHLFDPHTGEVWDGVNYREEINPRVYTYNLGTFIGAANFLGHTNDARLAADYAKNVLCKHGILPGYDQGGDGGGFNGICVRWLARFMRERRLENKYLDWLKRNADAAWKIRRKSDNLTWSRWPQPTPEGPLNSWACSSSVVILQVVPPSEVPRKGFFFGLFGDDGTAKK